MSRKVNITLNDIIQKNKHKRHRPKKEDEVKSKPPRGGNHQKFNPKKARGTSLKKQDDKRWQLRYHYKTKYDPQKAKIYRANRLQRIQEKWEYIFDKNPNYAPNVTREAYDKLKHSPRLLDYYYGEEEELLFGSLEKWLEFLKDWRYASKLHNKKKK